jgi:hypothetical protein
MKPSLLLVAVLSACHHGAATPATPEGPDLHGQLYVVTGDLKTDVPGADRLLPGLDAKLDGVLEAAGDVITAWPTGGAPTRAQVDASGAKSALLIGAITSVTNAPSGEEATAVSCKLSLQLMTYPERSMFGMIDGAASVEATTDPADIAVAEQDCVDAVLDNLLANKVLPAIRGQ